MTFAARCSLLLHSPALAGTVLTLWLKKMSIVYIRGGYGVFCSSLWPLTGLFKHFSLHGFLPLQALLTVVVPTLAVPSLMRRLPPNAAFASALVGRAAPYTCFSALSQSQVGNANSTGLAKE